MSEHNRPATWPGYKHDRFVRAIFRALIGVGVIGGCVLALLALCGRLLYEPTDTHGQTGLLWSLNSDPTTPPGIAAPTWQLLVRTDSPSIYYKSGTANTAWTSLSGGGGGGTVTGTGTANTLAKWSGASAIGNSSVTDNGTTVHTAEDITSAGSISAANNLDGTDVNATGIVTAGQLVSDTAFMRTASFGDATNDGVVQLAFAGTNGPTMRPHVGDPNGTVSALEGSLVLDSGGKLWVNTNGATAWSQLATAGASGPLYDTTIAAGTIVAQQNDWAPGALGQNTLITVSGGAIPVTGFAGGVDGKYLTVQPPQGGFAPQFSDNDAASAAANRICTFAGSPTTIGLQVAHTFLYYSSRWHQVN